MSAETNKHGLVDLLEIYFARGVRDHLERELRRLRRREHSTPGLGPIRRLEIGAYYERMLILNEELLKNLGDFERGA